ncbi:MAG: transcription antitermination factor NusB [Acidimicrobiales bacterium]
MTEVPRLGVRREAREDALAMLYEIELTGDQPSDALARREVRPDDYCVELVEAVCSARDVLDRLVSAHLTNWRIERLALVDLCLARMAACELLERPDVPTGVVLSELVELSTQYAGADSPRFLNGVLRAVADTVRG